MIVFTCNSPEALRDLIVDQLQLLASYQRNQARLATRKRVAHDHDVSANAYSAAAAHIANAKVDYKP